MGVKIFGRCRRDRSPPAFLCIGEMMTLVNQPLANWDSLPLDECTPDPSDAHVHAGNQAERLRGFLNRGCGAQSQGNDTVVVCPAVAFGAPGIGANPLVRVVRLVQGPEGILPVPQYRKGQLMPARNHVQHKLIGRINDVAHILAVQHHADGRARVVGGCDPQLGAGAFHRNVPGDITRVVGQPLPGYIPKAQHFRLGNQAAVGTLKRYAEVSQQIAPLQAVPPAKGQGNLQLVFSRMQPGQGNGTDALVHKPAVHRGLHFLTVQADGGAAGILQGQVSALHRACRVDGEAQPGRVVNGRFGHAPGLRYGALTAGPAEGFP